MSKTGRQFDRLAIMAGHESIVKLGQQLSRKTDGGTWVRAGGRVGSSTAFLAAAMKPSDECPILLVRAHLDEVDEAVDELRELGVDAERFPAMELLPGESRVRLDLLSDRLKIVRHLDQGESPRILVAPIVALMQAVPRREGLSRLHRIVRPGQSITPEGLMEWMVEAGYSRVQTIDAPGEFALRGDILDIYPGGGSPARLDFFGDEVERIYEIDLATMGSDRRLDRLDLVACGEAFGLLAERDGDGVSLISMLDSQWRVVMDDWIEIGEQARSYLERISDPEGIVPLESLQQEMLDMTGGVVGVESASTDAVEVELPIRPLPNFSDQAGEAFAELGEWASEILSSPQGRVTVWLSNEGDRRRFEELLEEFVPDKEVRARIERVAGYLHRGFCWGDESVAALVPYHELIHRYQLRRRSHRQDGSRAKDAFTDMQAGDFVVHRDHGIASFLGLQLMGRDAGESLQEEFLTLEFAKGARLHVPASEIELVQRYVGGFHGKPDRSILGGKRWQRQKEQAGESVRDLAERMLQLQAMRAGRKGLACEPDGEWQQEFEAAFPYEETGDQVAAITAVKGDLEAARPMDRLICGDVGFGKTEVAIRAAFKVVQSGRQVAVLVPTTVLAEQHGRTFAARFAGYPIAVESLSRFRKQAEQREILERLGQGQVDVIIGTHRLLSKDVDFSNLGLVVIDEEQRFGVEHKQRLVGLRAMVDILTMTATPIPRTLHMSMLGLRDISSLTTAPQDRRAVVTEVISWDGRRIKEALQRELAREGQAFVVHNRVSDLQEVADEIQKLVPSARIVVGHGQMRPAELEKVMLAFMRHEADILVSTTIIESGIDIPNANTMIINEADRFGLSDLHQLRGRVGRFKHRAYCYLLLPMTRTVNPDAKKRLRAIENFSMLGAGFRIAMQDLEIRGAGNLLGAEQSGHIAAVGYDMYCQLLERAVRELKEERVIDLERTIIDLGIRGYLPSAYIPAENRRMDAYRRVARAMAVQELDQVEEIVTSAYGPLPPPAARMWDLARIRVLAAQAGVVSIQRREMDLVFRATGQAGLVALEQRLHGISGTLRLVGEFDRRGRQEVYWRPPEAVFEDESLGSLLAMLRKRLAASPT
ncbi:MAG: transcription-repair coupling factor [Phycisphaerae bacterium]|nr:transcription-repair coupling factor [Phycisphaerae bacterium]